MVIARIGNIALNVKNYISAHTYTTYDLDIVKYNEEMDGDETCITIGDFNKSGEFVSCGDRIFDLDSDEYYDFCTIAKIGSSIISNTDEVKSGYKEMMTIKTYKVYPNEEKKVRHYPVEHGLGVYVVYDKSGSDREYYWNEEDAIENSMYEGYSYARVDVV